MTRAGQNIDVTVDGYLLQNTQILNAIPFHKPSDNSLTFTNAHIVTIDHFTQNFFESIHISGSDMCKFLS